MSAAALETSASRRKPKLSPLERSERRLGFVLLLPAFLLLGVVVLYPIAELLYTSVHFNHLPSPGWARPSWAWITSPVHWPTTVSGKRRSTPSSTSS